MTIMTRAKDPDEECKICDTIRKEYGGFGPPHRATAYCRSGKRNHCSCDSCF